MKFLMALFTFSVALAGVPELKTIPATQVFVPEGFDSNDNVEIVIEGILPNLCHKSPRTEVQLKGKEVLVTLKSLYYHTSNPYCPEMAVPFNKTVSLGVLDKGQYSITVNKSSRYEKIDSIKITQAKKDKIDNYQYSYVQEIQRDSATDIITFKGYNPSDCFKLDRVSHISNNKDTYSILPKMKQVYDFCPMKMVPFTFKWKLPKELAAKDVLLHVRTLNGDSINKIIKNYNK